jgi:D-alanyl-D-alanine carboxypeptidase (penicillin-binding protein 5/6)
MRGLPAGFVATVVLLLGSATMAAPAAVAQPAPPLPKAYVLVDVDTGAVIAQQDDRTVRPPASTIKLLTGLIASQRLLPGDGIPISPEAEGMPARKINVKSPQVWAYEHLMYSMMMVSANDAAVALAEKIGGGTLDGYVPIANETAARLGLADGPILNDPAGLDDEFAYKGGARISPRDLAIVARAVMATPGLMDIVNTRTYEFTGGDQLGHRLTNHNLFLDLYQGANGLKTGTTDLAGHTFVGSATRGGRTMLAVVFDAVDSYASAGALLDQGFNTPVAAEASLDHLPPVVANASVPPPTTVPAPVSVVAQSTNNKSFLDSTGFALLVLVVGLLPLRALRRRVVAMGALAEFSDDEYAELAGDLVHTGR